MRGRANRRFVWVALLGVAIAGCGAHSSPVTSSTPSTIANTPSPSAAPTLSPAGSCAEVVFDRLSLQQRVGQLFALGLTHNKLGPAELGAIGVRHVGSVWFTETTRAGVAAVRAVAVAVQAQATRAATDGVRFFIAANQEGGEIQALRGRGFSTIPAAEAQGRIGPATLQRDAAIWARQLSQAGVNLNFSPVMDVVPSGTEDQNAPIGALHREFGSDPSTVALHGTAFIRGMRAAGIVTTAKHFPGLGRVQGNTDNVAAVIDTVTTANDASLEPFRAAVAAGVPMVMVSLATYTRIDPHHLAVFSPIVMRLLRVEMRFGGVIASDSLTATAVSNLPPAQRAIEFLSAGGDLIVSRTVDPTVAMVSAVVARASSNQAFAARVDDAVRRVLAAKEAAGLLPCAGE